MPRRASLDDALGPRGGPEDRPAVTGPPPPEPETYKLTVVLTEEEHQALERLTEVVIAEVAPRRVGKGWRTKSIRALLVIAENDMTIVRRVAEAVRAEIDDERRGR